MKIIKGKFIENFSAKIFMMKRRLCFYGFNNVTKVVIPDSVTYIREYAFYEYFGLTDVYFENPNNWIADSTPLSSSDLSDSKTAAEFLRSTFLNREWKRN